MKSYFCFNPETVVVGIVCNELHEFFVANHSNTDGRDNTRYTL